MSTGPTRRLQRLLDERGAVDARWLPLAARVPATTGDQSGTTSPPARSTRSAATAGGARLGAPFGAPEGRHPCHRGGAESGTGQRNRDPR